MSEFSQSEWLSQTKTSTALRSIELVVDENRIGPGGSGARFITADDGNLWVMKANFLGGQQHRYLCLNEALCALIAYRLEVSVPECAVVVLSQQQLLSYKPDGVPSESFVFGSRVVEPVEPLSPEVASLVDPNQAAAIITLDALVRNTDRKPEHVLAQLDLDGDWKLWAIDHGHTLATADTVHGQFSAEQETVPPLDLLRQRTTSDDLRPWIERAESIDRHEFKRMVDGLPGPWVVEPDAADTLADALFQRAKALPRLLAPHFA